MTLYFLRLCHYLRIRGDKVTVEVKDAPEDAWEWLLGQVISGAFGTQDEIVEAARKTVGHDKVKRDGGADSERSSNDPSREANVF